MGHDEDVGKQMGQQGLGRPGERRFDHVGGLDGLRGAAVSLVLFGHLAIFAPGSAVFAQIDGWALGVDLFFVLSGFLITVLLLREQTETSQIRLRAFYWRRSLRLLPPLIALLGVHAVYAWASGLSLRSELKGAAVALSYISNWSWRWPELQLAPGMGHLWSLAIEEQFYLLWPLAVVLVGARRHVAVVGSLLGGAIVLVALNRLRLWESVGWWGLYSRTDARADSLLVGALAAHLWLRGLIPTAVLRLLAWPAAALVTLFVVTASSDEPMLNLGGYTIFAVATALLVLATVDEVWSGRQVLEWSVLRKLGTVSYGLYLWHLPVYFAVLREGAGLGVAGRMVTAITLTAILTAASWHFLERPLQRYRRLVPRGGAVLWEPSSLTADGEGASAGCTPGASVTDTARERDATAEPGVA